MKIYVLTSSSLDPLGDSCEAILNSGAPFLSLEAAQADARGSAGEAEEGAELAWEVLELGNRGVGPKSWSARTEKTWVYFLIREYEVTK